MSNPVAVIYHADCPDGFGSALAAWKQFGDNANYIPMHHGEDWQALELTGKSVFILDFSFTRDILEKMAGIAAAVTQIDHHASARSGWAGLLETSGNTLEIFRHQKLPLTIIFDLTKSGTRLSWEFFSPGRALALALRHIEDINMWRFAMPGTRAFSRSLRLLPFDFPTWDLLLDETESTESPRYQAMLAEGVAIEKFLECEIQRLSKSRLIMSATLRGEAMDPLQAVRHSQKLVESAEQSWLAIRGLAINADSLFASELGNKLAEHCGTFGLIWQLAADGEVKASLRAAGKVNVATIASRYGGGGHPNAAGFRMPVKRFMTEILGQKNNIEPTDSA